MNNADTSSPATEEELLETLNYLPSPEQARLSILKETTFRLDEHLSETLDAEFRETSVMQTESKAPNPELENDFGDAQANLRMLMAKSSKAINDMIILAGSSDNPRAYEVLAKLIETASQLNKDMVEMHGTKADIEKKKGVATGPQTVNQNMFWQPR